MQILDEDMQMVRDFLATAGAPEYIKGHFENLVAEHIKEAAAVEDMKTELDDLTEKVADRNEIEDERDRLQEDLDDRDRDELRALETVKYALHDIIHLGKPLQIMPRRLLEIVEDAL